MIIKNKTILVLAPHTDDGEFGCGATINKLIEMGNQVHYAAFSICEQSVPDHLPKDILAKEVRQATQILGIPSNQLYVFRYQVRIFPAYRQEILDELIRLRKKVNPDLIFIPSPQDVHQDHQVIAQEAIRAFKFKSIFSYELPWNNLVFDNTCFVHFEERHLNAKIEAIQAYESQKFRSYSDASYLQAQATFRGIQAGSKYAEVFEVIRLNVH